MSKSGVRTLTLVMALLATVLSVQMSAQAPPSSLVIDGATLIDGNGGTPLQNSAVVITGNKITAVGRKGQVTYPPNATVIKADGKFITPGLWDNHGYGTWFINDMYLYHGVTSIVDNGLGGELSIIHREAVDRGKIAGPRYVTAIGYFSSVPPTDAYPYQPKLFPDRVPKTPDEARDLVRGFVKAGANFIFVADGKLPNPINEAIADEAHKANITLVLEAVGPNLNLEKMIELKFDQSTHSTGIAEAVAKDPSKYTNELDLYSEMDDAKAQALVKRLVSTKVTLVPNFLNLGPGMPKNWERMQMENRQMFSDPDILTYFPEFTDTGRIRTTILWSLRAPLPPPMDPALFERRREGWLNIIKFHKMYADAGGRVTTGGNTNVSKAVGLDLHQELETFVEGGFTPMQAIQAATKSSAETFHQGDRLGTIEAGKLADLLILDADPLQDIHNTQKINQVIFNGKPVERKYHPWPSDPFIDIGNYSWGNPAVESLDWVEALKRMNSAGYGGGGGGRPAAGVPDPAITPQPAIETISPTLVTEGDPTTTVVIKGFNFVRRMQVYFDGKSVPYKAVSPTEIDLMLDSSLLRTPGKYDIYIKSPGQIATPEMGNGTSNTAHLLVNFKY